jgi:hypothetical protein
MEIPVEQAPLEELSPAVCPTLPEVQDMLGINARRLGKLVDAIFLEYPMLEIEGDGERRLRPAVVMRIAQIHGRPLTRVSYQLTHYSRVQDREASDPAIRETLRFLDLLSGRSKENGSDAATSQAARPPESD